MRAALLLLALVFAACAPEAPAPDPCDVDPRHPCAWPPGSPPEGVPVDAGLDAVACADAADAGECPR